MGSNNPTVGSSNISFSSLKSAYADASITSASGNSDLTDGNSNTLISLSFFRNATFTDSTSIPSSGEISINDDFKGKTFGATSTPQFDWHYYAYGSNIGIIYILVRRWRFHSSFKKSCRSKTYRTNTILE